MKTIKVFVWREVLCDWTCGHIVVVAYNIKQARDTVRKQLKESDYVDALKVFIDEPDIFDVPVMIPCYGSS